MSNNSNPSFGDLAREASLQPQEKLMAYKKDKNSLSIGIPRETTFQEHRVPLSPMAVQLLVQQGHTIKIESGCGEKANFSDLDYSSIGAEIVFDTKQVFECEVILKVAPLTEEEVEMMQPNKILISSVQMVRMKDTVLKKMLQKNIVAIGYEFLRDNEDSLSIIRSMSEIAGRASILIAAEFLSNYNSGKGELFGGIPGIHMSCG